MILAMIPVTNESIVSEFKELATFSCKVLLLLVELALSSVYVNPNSLYGNQVSKELIVVLCKLVQL